MAVQYRDVVSGKSNKFTIGTAEEMNAAKARQLAADRLAGIRHGVTPHKERQEKPRDEAGETLESVGKLYLAARSGGKKPLRDRGLEELRAISKSCGRPR